MIFAGRKRRRIFVLLTSIVALVIAGLILGGSVPVLCGSSALYADNLADTDLHEEMLIEIEDEEIPLGVMFMSGGPNSPPMWMVLAVAVVALLALDLLIVKSIFRRAPER